MLCINPHLGDKQMQNALMLKSLKIGMLMVGLALGGSLAACAPTPTAESTGAYVDDAAITTKVKAAILGDNLLKVFEIHVVTEKNVVQLSGFVDSRAAVNRATEVSAKVPGVRSVRNDLAIK
jgi:hyperosmotically inducible protein